MEGIMGDDNRDSINKDIYGAIIILVAAIVILGTVIYITATTCNH